uniref:ShTK domain protein n=1 Tax=Panagrellus redivivus TaxID=6233 RepID=A0A7E4W8J9_PANRE
MYCVLIFPALVAMAFAATTTTVASTTVTVPDTSPLRCQYPNRTLMTSAFTCSDQLSTCATIFMGQASGSTRPALCNNANMQDKAAQCAKTCGICCEQLSYDCVDSPFASFNCKNKKHFCNNADWKAIMTENCPATCGFCTQGSCRDLVSGCAEMAATCDNIHNYQWMSQHCARTCGKCDTSSCSDIAVNCAVNKSLCNNSIYHNTMLANCRKTCNFCNAPYRSPGSNSACVDSHRNCTEYVTQGFCNNNHYTPLQKRQFSDAFQNLDDSACLTLCLTNKLTD